MRNKLLAVLASLAAGLLCTPALNADSFTLKFDRAKASFSFSGGKVTMKEESDSYDAHFRTYAGTIRPRDVARNGADASRIQARLATAVETCRKLFKPGTKVDLADVEDALDRLGFTPDTFVEELGETLYSIG